jgi:polyisoprenoid-binding protein YceI
MENLKWVADPAHTEIQFKVKHLMITTITGHFKQFDILVETEDQDINSVKKIVFTADVDSIDTHNAQRDAHLKTSDFFDSAKFTQLKFEGKDLRMKKNDLHEMTGNLTIRNITRPVTFDVEFGGLITDSWGQMRAGFTVDGKLHRKDFGLHWNTITEAGNIVVGDEVKLHGEVELILQGAATPVKKEDSIHEAEVT